MRTKRPRHRGLGNIQIEDREKTEKKILDFMHKMVTVDIRGLERKEIDEIGINVHNYGDKDDPQENWAKHRLFWIRGISRGAGIADNTTTKALERLKEKGSVWEDPIPSNVRIFQLTYPGWEDSLKHSLYVLKCAKEQGKRHHTTIRISRIKQ